MYSGALYIVPIVVFSVLYNINKFYEVNTAFLLDEMNNTVGTARDPIWPDCESGIGFFLSSGLSHLHPDQKPWSQ